MKAWTVEALAVLAMTVVEHGCQPDGVAALGDATEEASWSHPLVMALVMTDGGRSMKRGTDWMSNVWRISFVDRCNAQADWYKGRTSSWARAVLAGLLFGGWDEGRRYPAFGTRSPWALVVRCVRKEQSARAVATKARNREWAAQRAAGRSVAMQDVLVLRCGRCGEQGGRRVDGMDFVCDACAADLSARMM